MNVALNICDSERKLKSVCLWSLIAALCDAFLPHDKDGIVWGIHFNVSLTLPCLLMFRPT